MSKTQLPIRIEASSKATLVAYAESINQKPTEATATLVEKLAFAIDKKEEPIFVELTKDLVLISSQEYLIMLTSLENAAKWENLQKSQEKTVEPEQKIGFVQPHEQPEEPTAQEQQPEPPKPHNIGRVGMI